MFLKRKIGSQELKSCIEAASNVHWVDNCLVLQPRYGVCTINFSDESIDSCTIQFKRISGNGLFLISSGSASCEHQVVSRNVHGISHRVFDGKVKIHRTQRSRGDLAILEVLLYKEGDAVVNWNDVLTRCDSFSCLRVVQDQLYASEGSVIKRKNLKVKTEPSGMYSIDNDTVRFLGSCRVLELSIDDQVVSANLISLPPARDPRLNNALKRATVPPVIPSVVAPVIPSAVSHAAQNTVPQSSSVSLINQNLDDVTHSVLEFSRSSPAKYVVPTLNVHNTIKTNTLSGLHWLNKISPFISSVQSSETPFASISCIDNLIPAKKMYVEEFSKPVPYASINTLRAADEVFVASNQNAEALRIHMPKVQVLPKYLPIVPSIPLALAGSEYVLLLNENPEVTNTIINSIPSSTRIVLIGARGGYASNVFPVNEYIPYQNLMYLFGNAKCYIDIPQVDDRVSEYVDLALAMGTQVITTSWAYMDYDSVSFIPRTETVKELSVPNTNDLLEAIAVSGRFPQKQTEHNQCFEKFIFSFLA